VQSSVPTVSAARDLCPICGKERGKPWAKAPDRFHGRNELYELLKCPTCSIVWLQDPPQPAQMPYHYGLDYHQLISSSGERALDKKWRTPKERVLKMARIGAILDLGCSSGSFLQSLKGGNLALYGIEISSEEAQRAVTNSGANVFVGEILDADFPPESFDIVTCFHFLEHVYKPREVLQKVRKWLKPGGVFYLLIPNIDALEMSIFRGYWYGLELPRHLYHFSPKSLRRLFELEDFEELFLHQQPDCYVEKSARYVMDDVLHKLGIARIPLAADYRIAGLLWRLFRKAYRLGILWPFRKMAAAAGHGAGLEAAFRKRT
jgi:SAM-dependent methyltransferase